MFAVSPEKWMNLWTQRALTSTLAKFQTPTVFDWDFDFYGSTFYRSHKIMKIIIYILYAHENASFSLI